MSPRLEFAGRKTIIGMVHLPPLPGAPFDRGWSPDEIISAARHDLDLLLEAGFDAVSFSNEGDRPYATTIPPEQLAVFTHVLSRLTAGLKVRSAAGC